MVKLIGFLVLSLFLFASLADLSSGNETVVHHKTRRNHKKDAKHEYYLSRHVDHPDVDAETIQKHGVSLEDAKMQADGLLEPKGKKVKMVPESTGEEAEAKLQEMGKVEEKQHQRRHHRHEVKVHEKGKSEGSVEEEISKKDGIKEKKLIKSRKSVESSSETVKSEEVKIDGNKDTETVKHTGGKRNHDKRRRGHKHGFSGHKNKKHGGKKSHKPSKEKKDKKNRKISHHN